MSAWVLQYNFTVVTVVVQNPHCEVVDHALN